MFPSWHVFHGLRLGANPFMLSACGFGIHRRCDTGVHWEPGTPSRVRVCHLEFGVLGPAALFGIWASIMSFV